MPCSGVDSVPNRLRATAMDHRIAAQYGQYSAPMYSISGLPLLVSSGPVTLVTGGEVVMTEPLPTVARALAGTPVTLLATLAGRGVRPVEVGVVVGELIDLTRMKATTMTMTASTLPPVMNRRLRCSARFSAARWAAIFSRAFCCLILVALPIAQSSENDLSLRPAALYRRALPGLAVPGPAVAACRATGDGP